ncbi:Ubiquinone biosynthesis protein COQ9, mitochondrial [Galdieria sulphuraria]|uniref:Ubiquinone biosynthesis protein n=1 Tax=Galdieria sulphuraria TaxID=130081 RepID=M2XGK1_GALSU|nr:uncharacterized protein Gasu_33940 [Galdieria sulphuraria]EME29192.1 hypothetical protein Gasu_33940 [Galdieria sulphuraria]GJD11430.1 Ubiquinone biosynthesis protein COQ9, mitochondrial [Galdieria sulphuraria]|eukprot:XP_005705712.1 hypothetical protein Gasu_33940 [Galdieria sulphuraria]
MKPMHPKKLQLLQKSLEYVPAYGFTSGAVKKAVEDLGLSQAAKGLLERGLIELIEFHHTDADKEAAIYAHQIANEDLESKDVIIAVLQKRFQLSGPFQPHWSRAMALEHLPQNWPDATKRLFYFIGELLHATKDKSTNGSWYTKRFALASVYRASELYWVSDSSDSQKMTNSFIAELVNSWNKADSALGLWDAKASEICSLGFRTAESLFRSVRSGF